MDTPNFSPELKAQEELDDWRRNVGRHSLLMPLLRQPHDFADLFSILEEAMGVIGNNYVTPKILEQIQIICSEACAEYGEEKAFWLMVDYTSEEESEIMEQLQPDLADMEDTHWTELDGIFVAVNHASAELADTLPSEVCAYYETMTGILDIYFPADYTSTQALDFDKG